MKRFLLIIFIFIKTSTFAQQIIWEKSLGGSLPDIGYSLYNYNGNIIGLGSTTSTDFDVTGLHFNLVAYSDFWLFQVDTNGNLINQSCIGGSYDDEGRKMIRTMDGGFMLAGYASSNDGDVTGSGTVRQKDYWLAKTDSAFNIQWGKLIGGGLTDIPSSIIQTTDSGFLVIGSSYNFGGYIQIHYGQNTTTDIFIAKVSKSGAFEWGKTLGGSNYDDPGDVVQTLDGGYLLVGSSSSRDYDIPPTAVGGLVIFKLDSLGNIQFIKTHGGNGGDAAMQIISNDDGTFTIIGTTISEDGEVIGHIGSYDVWVLKIDSLGDIIWQKCLGSHGWEQPTCAIKTNDGGYLIGATSFWGDSIIQNHGNFEDCWLVKIDSGGNYQWSKIFGGSNDDNVFSIIQTSDHEYIFTGSTQSYDYDVSNCHGIPNCYEDVWLVKFSDGTNQISEFTNSISDLSAFYSNENLLMRYISSKNEKLNLSVYDLMGKSVFEKSISCSQGLNTLSIPFNCSIGVYLLQVSSENSKQTVRVIVN